MNPTHPTLKEAIDLLVKIAGELKQLPFDKQSEERRTLVQESEEMSWRYNNLQNGGAK